MSTDFSALLQEASQELSAVYPHQCAAFFWVDQDGQFQQKAFFAQPGSKEDGQGSHFLLKDYIVNTLVGQNHPVFLLNSNEKQEQYLLIATPLAQEGQVHGILSFWAKPDLNQLPDADYNLLSEFGQKILDQLAEGNLADLDQNQAALPTSWEAMEPQPPAPSSETASPDPANAGIPFGEHLAVVGTYDEQGQLQEEGAAHFGQEEDFPPLQGTSSQTLAEQAQDLDDSDLDQADADERAEEDRLTGQLSHLVAGSPDAEEEEMEEIALDDEPASDAQLSFVPGAEADPMATEMEAAAQPEAAKAQESGYALDPEEGEQLDLPMEKDASWELTPEQEERAYCSVEEDQMEDIEFSPLPEEEEAADLDESHWQVAPIAEDDDQEAGELTVEQESEQEEGDLETEGPQVAVAGSALASGEESLPTPDEPASEEDSMLAWAQSEQAQPDQTQTEDEAETLGFAAPPVLAPETRKASAASGPEHDLLRYSNQGFVAFDKRGIIQNRHLEGAKRILGQVAAGDNALELLFQKWNGRNWISAGFQKDPDLSMIQDLMETVFLRITDLDVLVEMLPLEIYRDQQTLRAEYRYLKADDMDQDNILILFTDISREKQLEAQILIEKQRNDMIVKVALDADGYKKFRDDAHQLVASLLDLMTQDLHQIRLESALPLLDHLQSGFELYEISELVRISSNLVQGITRQIQEAPAPAQDKVDMLVQEILGLEETFDFLHEKYFEVLSAGAALEGNFYPMSESKLKWVQEVLTHDVMEGAIQDLLELMVKNYTPFTRHPQLKEVTSHRLDRMQEVAWEILDQAREKTDKLFLDLKKRPLSNQFNKFALVAESMGKREGKQVLVEMQGGDIEVPYQKFEELFSSLNHVIRNAVEHGLEKMEERVFWGKNLEGKITISAGVEDGHLHLTIADDGRGLDLDSLREKAQNQGVDLPPDSSEIPQEQLLDLLLDLGFSSKEGQPGSTGRGVGLDTVKESVRNLGGQMKLSTQKEEGTSLQIKVPLGG